MNVNLIFGCHGHKDSSGFIQCNSCSNILFNFKEIPREDLNTVIDFLDNACNLFDYICNDTTKTINILNLMQKKYYKFPENKLHSIQYFMKQHKACGLYLMIQAGEVK